MFHVVLYEPEIPPNTGNIIRLCANTGSYLHLIHPIAFDLDDRKLRRAGLDYRDLACVHEHASLAAFLKTYDSTRVWAISTRGARNYSDVTYQDGDALLFGPETRGLPAQVLASLSAEQILRIPMVPEIRSLNVSNAVAVVLYEAWRQNDFNASL